MQYQVPQFIDTEDKIIGGLMTLKQFLIVAGGAGVSFILFFLFSFFAWFFLTLVIAVLILAIAFIKISGRPLPVLAFAAFNYYWRPRFYLWQSKKAEPVKIPQTKTPLHKTSPLFFKKEGAAGKTPAATAPKSYAPSTIWENFKKFRVPKSEPKPETKPGPMPEIKHEIKAPTEPKKEIPAEPAITAETPEIPHEIIPETPEPRPSQPETSAATEPKPQPVERPSVPVSEIPKPKEAPRESQPVKQEAAAPVIKIPPVQETKEAIETIRRRIAGMGSVQNLFEKITTSKISLPKREKAFSLFTKPKPKLGKTMVRKATGELLEAKQVDY